VVATPKALLLQKMLVGGVVGKPDSRGRPYVNAGSTITYALCFSNPSTSATLTQLYLVDTLPREVAFVSADGDRSFGSYDDQTRTYTWRFDALGPGAQKCVNLVVRVADKLDPNTVITNSATLSTGQGTTAATTTTARIDIVVRPVTTDVAAQQMYIKPDHIYRNSSSVQSDLMIVIHLPDGIGMAAISSAPLVLTPGNVKATGQMVFGSSTQGKILGFFEVNPVLAATQGTAQEYGECPVRVTGKLNDGRSFFAEGKIWILKFSGP
jgi:uncharacterized repeat protein (TIGR01451 family)